MSVGRVRVGRATSVQASRRRYEIKKPDGIFSRRAFSFSRYLLALVHTAHTATSRRHRGFLLILGDFGDQRFGRQQQ